MTPNKNSELNTLNSLARINKNQIKKRELQFLKGNMPNRTRRLKVFSNSRTKTSMSYSSHCKTENRRAESIALETYEYIKLPKIKIAELEHLNVIINKISKGHDFMYSRTRVTYENQNKLQPQ